MRREVPGPGGGREEGQDPGGAGAPAGGRRSLLSRALATALALTLLLGGWLRWALAGSLPLVGDFAHLRHAHSHLGYYGVLFPLAWLGWRAAGAPVPGKRTLAAYAGATLLAFTGFLRAGYGPEAMAGSTVVGAVWLVSAWRLRDRVLRWGDPLAPVLPGVILAEACIPFIATSLDADPARAQAWVATFLALLLLGVLVPSALAARGVRLPGAPLFGVAAVLGAAALGIAPGPWTSAGLGLYALWILYAALRHRDFPLHLRSVWAAVGVGLGLMAGGALPNARPVVVGAIHFLVLAPVLGSLVPAWLPRPLPEAGWWVGHGMVVLLTAPLVLQGMGGRAWTLTASALGGTGVVTWWGWALLRTRRTT